MVVQALQGIGYSDMRIAEASILVVPICNNSRSRYEASGVYIQLQRDSN